RLVAIGRITRQSLLADLYEHRSQVAQLVCTRACTDSLLRPVGCKCLQVFPANLGRSVNAIAPLPHDLCEGVERRTARFSRQIGTAQLIPDSLQVRLQLSLPTHTTFLLKLACLVSFRVRQSQPGARHPAAVHPEWPDANTSG